MIDPTLKLSALVADDNVINLQLCKALLAKLGYLSTTAKDGLEALKLMQEQLFDVVVMDHQMPVMDGCTATKAYREWEKSQSRATRLPIIALTANAGAKDEDYYLSAGMDYFLTKPLTLAQLTKALKETVTSEATFVEGQPTAPRPVVSPVDTPDTATVPLMNRDEAMQLACNDTVLLGLIANAFIAQSTELRADLRAALVAEDGQALARHAHKLKGSVSVFAAEAISSVAEVMNRTTAPYDWPQLRAQGERLDANIERLIKELSALQT